MAERSQVSRIALCSKCLCLWLCIWFLLVRSPHPSDQRSKVTTFLGLNFIGGQPTSHPRDIATLTRQRKVILTPRQHPNHLKVANEELWIWNSWEAQSNTPSKTSKTLRSAPWRQFYKKIKYFCLGRVLSTKYFFMQPCIARASLNSINKIWIRLWIEM